MAGKIMTLLAKWVLKRQEFTILLLKNYREMTRPNNYYGPLLQTNYEKTTAKIIPNSK